MHIEPSNRYQASRRFCGDNITLKRMLTCNLLASASKS